MSRRRALQAGALAWAAVGAAVALPAVATANADARVIVGIASTLGPLAAAAASIFLLQRRDTIAGLLLLLSVATPVYFAWVLGLPALLAGLALLIAPQATVGDRPGNRPGSDAPAAQPG
jgi:hypothetical protein